LRRHNNLLAAVVAAAMLIAACSRETGQTGELAAALPTAATLGEQSVLAPGEYLASAPYDSADRENGKRQAQFCRACHSLERGGRHLIGPSLYGMFGTEAGSQSGFEYSPVLRDADFAWTPAALNAWLAQPARFLPGNRMTFAGVVRERDRTDLIAYLLAVTSDNSE